MMESLLLVELVVLAVLQATWCVYYGTRYRWRATPLGPVWLAKGCMLALLWPLLAINEGIHLPSWVWTTLVAPGQIAATAAWLAVTVRVRRP